MAEKAQKPPSSVRKVGTYTFWGSRRRSMQNEQKKQKEL